MEEATSFGRGLLDPLLLCERVSAALLSGVLVVDLFALPLVII